MTNHKEAALDFLNMVVAGKIEEAYAKHVDMGGKHHNAYFPAGFPALKKAMIEAHTQFPNKRFSTKHVLGDGDLVAVHSHMALIPGEKEVAVVHLLRFQGNKIVEMWDCGQILSTDSPNKDGVF